MRWLLTRFFKSLTAFAALVGIFFLPSNIEDAGHALAPYKRFAELLTQSHALWIFAVLALIYIVWMDLRPWLSEELGIGPKSALMKRAEDAEQKLWEATRTRPAYLKSLPIVAEGPERNEARKEISIAAKECLWPAIKRLGEYYADARDALAKKVQIDAVGKQIIRGSDKLLGTSEPSSGHLSILELQSYDTIRKLSLHDAEASYYYCYCRYMEDLELTYALIKAASPMAPGQRDKIKASHYEWNSLHERIMIRSAELAKKYPMLHTIPTMHEVVMPSLEKPNWDAITD